MAVFALGLAGGLDAIYEQSLDSVDNYTYDGAAVLLQDGCVAQAMEEERLDRLKHSNKFPIRSIRHCLTGRGLEPDDLDCIAYYVDEASADGFLTQLYLSRPDIPQRLTARDLLRSTLSRALGCEIDPAKIRFYEHRLTHAACAMHQSGFAESLIYVIDNAGGVYHARRDPAGGVTMDTLGLTAQNQSVQKLCHVILPLLGLGLFEEHKAAALATYGDPVPFEDLLASLVTFETEGAYRLKLDRVSALLDRIAPPRSGASRTQDHYDLAAALQRMIERIVGHVLGHYREHTGVARVCVAGGMAENAWTAAAILSDARFEEAFVHPAAYDSGCALGAALLASQDMGAAAPRARVSNLRWGGEIGTTADLQAEVRQWSRFLRTEPAVNIAAETAALIAGGKLVAWVMGRSNFGTRALGGRNVFADPSVPSNRERTHRALGRSETFRPLSAFVRVEELHDWCHLPDGVDALPFQSCAVAVREARRADLAAAVHGDWTARIQSVSRDRDPLLWALLDELAKQGKAAALLSTSFNCGGEPVVETAGDAVTSFLRSNVDRMAIGGLICSKGEPIAEGLCVLSVALPPYTQVVLRRGWTERQRRSARYELSKAFAPGAPVRVSEALGRVLAEVDTEIALGDLVERCKGKGGPNDNGAPQPLQEVMNLWADGLVELRPSNRPEVKT